MIIQEIDLSSGEQRYILKSPIFDSYALEKAHYLHHLYALILQISSCLFSCNMRQSACFVFNPIMVDNYAAFFNCTRVGRAWFIFIILLFIVPVSLSGSLPFVPVET